VRGTLTFQFKPIGDPQFDMKGITNILRAAVLAEGAEHRMLLEKTVRTWEGEKPEFVSEVKVGPKQVTLRTGPEGDDAGAKKWMYLEKGTSIRWAVMSKGFKAKTRRAFLKSYRGKGGAVIVGKRAMMARNIRPRPGIPARNWLAEVDRQRSRKFKGLMQRVFGLIARNTIRPKTLRNP